MVTKKPPKTPKEFECKFCDFKCSNKKDYNRHLLTRKHKILTDPNKKMPDDNTVLYSCICGKKYKHRQSLNNHKQKCHRSGVFVSREKPCYQTLL